MICLLFNKNDQFETEGNFMQFQPGPTQIIELIQIWHWLKAVEETLPKFSLLNVSYKLNNY